MYEKFPRPKTVTDYIALLFLPLFRVISWLKEIYYKPDRTLKRSGSVPEKLKGKWKKKAPLPTYRYEFTGALAEDYIYLVGGLFLPTVYTVTRRVERYNTTSDTWEQVRSFPKIIHHAGTVSCQDTLYVVGGNGLRIWPYKSTYKYDEVKDLWVKLHDMPTARGALGVCSIGRYMYAIGGGAHKKALAACERYDTVKNTWEKLPDMPTPREHLAVASSNGKVFVFGGYTKSLSECLTICEMYDPKKKLWTNCAPLPTAVAGCFAASIGKSIFLFGGEQGWAVSGEVLEYRTDKDMWYRRCLMPKKRYASAVVAHNDHIHVIGGNSKLHGYLYSTEHDIFIP